MGKLAHDIFAASICVFSSSFPVILFHENTVASHVISVLLL